MAMVIKAGRTDDVQRKVKTSQTPSSVCVLCVTQHNLNPGTSSVSRPNKVWPQQAIRETTAHGRFNKLLSNYTFHL